MFEFSVTLQALAAIEANLVESDEEVEVEVIYGPSVATSELPSHLRDSARSLVSTAPAPSPPVPAAAAAAVEVKDSYALPGAPCSSPAKGVPFSATMRLRAARLARQRLMSPVPVNSGRLRKRISSTPSSASGVENISTSDFAAVQATMLMGLWRLDGDDET